MVDCKSGWGLAYTSSATPTPPIARSANSKTSANAASGSSRRTWGSVDQKHRALSDPRSEPDVAREVGPLPALWAPDTSPATAKASPVAKAPAVLLELSGSGTKTTQTFAVKGNWDLAWAYDCTSTGYDGNFIVMGYTAAENKPDFEN